MTRKNHAYPNTTLARYESLAAFRVEVRENFFTEEASLLKTVIAPQFQHHLRAACGVVFLQFLDALPG